MIVPKSLILLTSNQFKTNNIIVSVENTLQTNTIFVLQDKLFVLSLPFEETWQFGSPVTENGSIQRARLNPLMPNVNYSGRTAPLTSKVAFYIFIQQI